jgi:hypothetical protein
MVSSPDFVRQSLDLHLFFARIMKEHSFFLEAAFTPRDTQLMQQADMFRMEFDRLLAHTVSLSNGVVSNSVLHSGEVVTPYTLKAESATTFFTGVQIPTSITQAELGLVGNGMEADPLLAERVSVLNQRAMDLTSALIQFKRTLLDAVLTCKVYTTNYPLLIEHIMREAILYLQMVQRLQNQESIDLAREAYELEAFWNRQMAEHALFIRGLLDPSECNLIITANNFAGEFNKLTAEAINAINKTLPLKNVTDESLDATRRLRDFKRQGTQGILECKIRSIIIPLLGDHVLREANHYLRLLKTFENIVRKP